MCELCERQTRGGPGLYVDFPPHLWFPIYRVPPTPAKKKNVQAFSVSENHSLDDLQGPFQL